MALDANRYRRKPTVQRAPTRGLAPVVRDVRAVAVAAVVPSAQEFGASTVASQTTVLSQASGASPVSLRLPVATFVSSVSAAAKRAKRKIIGFTAAALFLAVLSAIGLSVNQHVAKSHAAQGRLVATTGGLAVHSASGNAGSLAVNSSGNSIIKQPNSPAASSNSVAAMPFTPLAPTDRPLIANPKSGVYDSAHQNFSFNDLFLAEPVKVSEQLLPTGFATAAQALAKVAASFNASTTLATNNGTAYLSTNYQNAGKQIVVFSAHGLLVFVQAAYEHPANEWPAYVNEYN